MDVRRPTTAPTALELLRAAAHAGTPFDVAVVDMKMPMHGRTDAGRASCEPIRCSADVELVMLTSLGSGTKRPRRAMTRHRCLPDQAGAAGANCFDALAPASAICRASVARACRRRSATATPQTPARRVLVAEDNVVNQEVARAMLERPRLPLRVAANGREALDRAARRTLTTSCSWIARCRRWTASRRCVAFAVRRRTAMPRRRTCRSSR